MFGKRERLEFEPALIAQITQASRRPAPERRKPWYTIGALGVLVAILTVAFSLRFGNRDERAVIAMVEEFGEGIIANELDRSLALFEDGAIGAPLIAAERARIGNGQGVAELSPAAMNRAQAERRATLMLLREELEAAGLRWDDAELVAFGGVQADVRVPELMRRAAVGITGNLYLRSGGRHYRIEVSAKRCRRRYVLTDIWQWGPVELPETALQPHASEKYLSFKNELNPSTASPVQQPRFIFVSLG